MIYKYSFFKMILGTAPMVFIVACNDETTRPASSVPLASTPTSAVVTPSPAPTTVVTKSPPRVDPVVAYDANRAHAPGESIHGEAFNEGPHQRGSLMQGTGNVHFPITTTSEEAQKFFDQGIGQLHGFWVYEAERSFRRVLEIDSEAVMALWGMAMANTVFGAGDRDRARELIQIAKAKMQKLSHREQMYITAYAKQFEASSESNPDPQLVFVKGLKQIMEEFPEDLDAKAFYVLEAWDLNLIEKLPTSKDELTDILDEVLEKNPMHPVHHYKIHLRMAGEDAALASKALQSAALCGPAAPAIAHMWHMPAHIYDRLHRWWDSAYQREASARVDHRYMMKERVMPYQIHNFGHNNELLIQSLIQVGAVKKALSISMNMLELPQMPRHEKNVSSAKDEGTEGQGDHSPTNDPRDFYSISMNGTSRLLDTLYSFEMWNKAIELSKTVYLQESPNALLEAARLYVLGVAYANSNRPELFQANLNKLEKVKSLPIFQEQKAEEDQMRKLNSYPYNQKTYLSVDSQVDERIADLKAYREYFFENKKAEALNRLSKSHITAKEKLALLYLYSGDSKHSIRIAGEAVDNKQDEVVPLAVLTYVLWKSGDLKNAGQRFEHLRSLSEQIDLEVEIFSRLNPLVQELHLKDVPASGDWRKPRVQEPDIGERPNLDTLGPERWSPVNAPDFQVQDETGRTITLRDYISQPVLLVLYLGADCEFCVDQLRTLLPTAPRFNQLGISVLAIGTDARTKKTTDLLGISSPVPSLAFASDKSFETFRAFRAFDDFESDPANPTGKGHPMHGIFLISGDSKVRWQTIGAHPFTNFDFLLKESKRLLADELK